MKIKELMELANIKELKEGPVYVMLVPDTADLPPNVNEWFAPADVRVVLASEPKDIRIFELEP